MKEDTEELELTSGGREFHRRHDEGMKEERYKEEEQAGSSTVPVVRRLYSHRLFTDFGMREERQGGPWLFTSFGARSTPVRAIWTAESFSFDFEFELTLVRCSSFMLAHG